jgi:hypothetical protein
MSWAGAFLKGVSLGQGAPRAGRQKEAHLGPLGQWSIGSHSQSNLWSHFGIGLGETQVPTPALTSAEKG